MRVGTIIDKFISDVKNFRITGHYLSGGDAHLDVPAIFANSIPREVALSKAYDGEVELIGDTLYIRSEYVLHNGEYFRSLYKCPTICLIKLLRSGIISDSYTIRVYQNGSLVANGCWYEDDVLIFIGCECCSIAFDSKVVCAYLK